jgi:hypothetical protein
VVSTVVGDTDTSNLSAALRDIQGPGGILDNWHLVPKI